MKTYKKGSRIERELLKYFREHGFLAIRVAGSGVSRAPDVFVVKKGKQYVFEIKAHEKNKLYISKEQYNILKKWEDNGILAFVVWKKKREDFVFIPIYLFNKTSKGNYVINWENAHDFYKKEDLI